MHTLVVRSGGDVADSCHYLQLSRSFVDIGNADVPVEALTSLVFHIPTTAVDLYAIIHVLIGELGAKSLTDRCEGIG